MFRCEQCKRVMNVVDYLVGVVCLACCRVNQRIANGDKAVRVGRKNK